MKRLAIAAATLLWASGAAARDEVPLGGEGAPITTNNYSIDLFQGPVLGGARMTGLAGAYAPIAEGVMGFTSNSAAPAVRPLWSRSWFDYDWDLGVTFPNALAKTDFDNNGSVGFRYRQFIFFTAGLNLQFGEWGFGVSAQLQQYELGQAAGIRARLGLARVTALLARSFLNGQLVVGAGVRVASFSFSKVNNGANFANDEALFSTQSLGPEAGVLVAPVDLPMRFALTGRMPLQRDTDFAGANNTQSDTQVPPQRFIEFNDRIYLPNNVVQPWEVEAGMAFQIGKRPLNEAYINPKTPPEEYLEEVKLPDGGTKHVLDKKKLDKRLRDRYRGLPREKLLVTTSVIIFGRVPNAVGVESFLTQRVEQSGAKVNVSPRIGIEAEPFANAIQIRAGSYLEPTRFARSSPRLHGTLGLEARLFRWNVFGLVDDDTSWRVGAYGDFARGYFGWGVTAGVWY